MKYLYISSMVMVLFCGFSICKAQNTTDTLIHLNEVLIEGKKPAHTIIQLKSRSFEVKSIPDIGDLLRTVPNVSGIRKGGACIDPVIRGFRYSQLNIMLNNGTKIEGGCPNRMDPVTSHVEEEDVKNIEVIKGPYVLKYGPSFGGIVNMITDMPHFYSNPELHTRAFYGFETNANGQREHLSLYGGNKSLYFNVSGGYKNFGNYKDGNDKTIKTSFQKYNFSGNLAYRIKQNQMLMLSYYETHGRDVLFPALAMDEKSDDTRIFSLDYHAKQLAKNIRFFDCKIYRSQVDHLMDNSKRANYSTMEAVSDVDALNSGGRTEIGFLLGKSMLNIGADYERIDKDGNKKMTMIMDMGGIITRSTKKFNIWNKALIQNTGVFAEYITNIKSFNVVASLRGDYNAASSDDTLTLEKDGTNYFTDNSSNFINYSFGFTISRKIMENFNVGFSIGMGTRSPNMLERYIKFMPVGFDNYDYLGNPQLKPEKNHQLDISLEYDNETFGNVLVNGFYSHITDYITGQMLSPSVATPQSQWVLGVKQFKNVDEVNFTGFELKYQLPDKYRFGGSLQAAYTRATIPSTTKYIVVNNEVTSEKIIHNDPLPEIPPFESTLELNYKLLNNKLIPSLSWRLVAEQNQVSNAFYEATTPGFQLLNFSLTYTPYKFVTIASGVKNIFDKPYYEHLNRKIIGSTSKLYEPGRLFFINLLIQF